MTGRDETTTSYSQGEMEKILDASRAMFAAHDLGTPTSFRAGGWTADAGTLMRAIYAMNHDGGTLDEPTVYQVGFHPPSFSSAYMDRMDAALDLVDEHLHESDTGPAVYVTISELTRVWK